MCCRKFFVFLVATAVILQRSISGQKEREGNLPKDDSKSTQCSTTVTIEPPFSTTTGVVFTKGGRLETFDDTPGGMESGMGSGMGSGAVDRRAMATRVDFGTEIVGSYQNMHVRPSSDGNGVGATGKYIAANNYALTVKLSGRPTMFGLYINQLRGEHTIEFNDERNRIFSLDDDAKNAIFKQSRDYYSKTEGTPRVEFPFVYVNFLFTCSYDSISIVSLSGGREQMLRSDNHVAGIWSKSSGDVVYSRTTEEEASASREEYVNTMCPG